MMLVPDRSADTDWKKTCPWCGRKFPSSGLMQDHEQQCPKWDRPATAEQTRSR